MKEIKKFDMNKKPRKTNSFNSFVISLLLPLLMSSYKHKLTKQGFKKIKGGCLIIGNHMSFEDFKFLIKLVLPRHSYYVVSIDEFVGKEKLIRDVGGIPKKVFYMDLSVVRTMVKLLKKGEIVTVFPEATYSFAGIPNEIDQSLGKLAKMAKVPVIVLQFKGNYLYSPRWNTLPKNKEVPLLANAIQVVSKQEVETLSADEIQDRINKAFVYDEYKYQKDNNIKIKSKTKAHNIHRILYKCPSCNNEMCIEGQGNLIKCKSCNDVYEIDELSVLHNLNSNTKFDSISSWYKWQISVVKQQLLNNEINMTFPVKISTLINAKIGFDHNYAKGVATVNDKGIFIKAKVNETNEDFYYEYLVKSNSTIHLTFDVKGCKESAFEVHNATDTYLVYPLDNTSTMKIKFIIEEAHKNLSLKNKS